MKKILIAMCVALLSMSAQAQEKGNFAVGLRGGATISKIKIEGLSINETSTRFGIGVFGQYNLTNHWRLDLEGIYHPKKDGFSDFVVGLNVHYLFNIGEDVRIYPLLGYGLSFGSADGADTETDGGIQLGAGIQYNFQSNLFLAGEYKYQPGLFGDGHVPMVSIGYRF